MAIKRLLCVWLNCNYYALARRKEANKHCFCLSICQSVGPSVAYIPNNSRTRRSSVPKFRMKVPHLWCDLHTSLKVRRWKVEVTRTINADHWLSCDADTSVAYLPMATYHITLVGVFLGHFCINLRQTRTQNSNEGLQRYNEKSPILNNRFPNLEFCCRRTVIWQSAAS